MIQKGQLTIVSLIVFGLYPVIAAAQGADGAAYDAEAFRQIKWGNTRYISPYLECYAEKHNLELISVTGNAYRFDGNYTSPATAKEVREPELPNLAEIETLLKSKLPTRPNTGKDYHENPAIWEEISTKRTEYLRCLISRAAANSTYMKMYRETIAEAQKEVDSYTPDRGYFVKAGQGEYILYAVSPQARAKWMTGETLDYKPKLDPLLDALARSAVKKLPMYIPEASYFRLRDAAAEKLLMNNLKSPATVKVYRIGVSSGWDIQKDNYGLLPSYRYKYANVYYRDSSDDHPFCRVMSARIKQDYAGGGRYNAQMYRSSTDFSLAGCPAAQ